MAEHSKELGWFWRCKWCVKLTGASGFKTEKGADIAYQIHLANVHRAN